MCRAQQRRRRAAHAVPTPPGRAASQTLVVKATAKGCLPRGPPSPALGVTDGAVWKNGVSLEPRASQQVVQCPRKETVLQGCLRGRAVVGGCLQLCPTPLTPKTPPVLKCGAACQVLRRGVGAGVERFLFRHLQRFA